MLTNGVRMSVIGLKSKDVHIHHGLQCIFLLRGSAIIQVEEEEIGLNAEDLLVIDSNQLHAVVAECSNIALVLEIEREYLLNECTTFVDSRVRCHCIGHSDESSNYYGLKRTLTRMLYIALKKVAGYQLDFKVELLRFIHILYTNFRIEPTTEMKDSVYKKRETINNVIGYINDNYSRPLKLEEMAKREYMTPQYFSKFFKRKTGRGFLNYLTELRLKKVVYALVDTDDSLIKIALDNGFANAKSLNVAFKKKYNDTPSNFRKGQKAGLESEQMENDGAGINLNVDVDLKEFMRYLKKYDINFEQMELIKKNYEVRMDDESSEIFRVQDNILNIGKVETAGYTNLLQQLELLRDRLGFCYVYFELENNFIPGNIPYSLILNNQFFRTVEQLEKLQIKPFLKVVLNKEFLNWDVQKIKETLHKNIEAFLLCIAKVYDKRYVETWKINIEMSMSFDANIRDSYYSTWYRMLKERYPKMQVGIYALNDSENKQKIIFDKFLSMAKEKNMLPDFVTFGVFPTNRVEKYMADQFFYSGLQQYYKDIIDTIKDIYTTNGCQIPPLYMIEWNSLMGNLNNESILYFRSALIVDLLLQLNGEIAGAGYWADSAVSAIYSDEPPMSSLALYMLDDVRRPIHPVLEMLKRVGTQIIYKKKNILVSRTTRDKHIILVWNPVYLNPSYSLDDITIESLRKNVNIKLYNLPAGIYQVKKITCNKENSGALTQLAEAGYPDFTDVEVFDYVKYNIANGLHVYEEYIFNGTYVLNTTLLYNSVVMYIIEKKDS